MQLNKGLLRSAAITAAVALATLGSARAETVRFLLGSPPAISMTDVYVADKAGFFKEEGITTEVNFAQNGAVGTQLVANGQAEIGDVTMEPLIAGHSKGMRGKFLATRGNLNIFYVVVDADSGIKSIKDLEGKKIGVLSLGSSAVYYVKSMLRDAGLDPNGDYFLPVGVGDSAMAALRSGQVQALALNRIFYASLARGGAKFANIYHPTIGTIPNWGYLSSDATLASKREHLVGYIRALIKSDIFIRANPEAAIRIFWERHPEFKPQGDEAAAMKAAIGELAYNPDDAPNLAPERISPINLAELQKLIDALKLEGLTSDDLKASDIADPSLYEEAMKGVDAAAIEKLASDWK